MTFKSTIDPSTDKETLFDSKNRVVAVYEKGKCKKVIDRLCFAPLHGYYEAKDTSYYKYSDSLVEPNSEDLNITRCCTNKDEYLKATLELKYHTFIHSIFDDPYKEKQWRIKYNRQIEILEKSGYWWLLDKKSVLKLNKKDLRKYIKLFGMYDDVKNSMNAFKKGFTDYDEYLYDRDIRQVMSKLHFDKKTAKYFLKKYGVRVFAGNLKKFITLYQDILNLAKELGINEIGFPSDLRAYEQHLIEIELRQKKDLKSVSNRRIKAVKGIAISLKNKSLKNYKVDILNTPRKIKEVAIEFHNCIYTNYLQEVVKGDYIIGLITKDDNTYACVGFRDGKVDQLYGKFNKALPQDEYKKITRSLKLVRI